MTAPPDLGWVKPPGAVSDTATRVLLAVVDGCTTYPELIERTGLSKQTLHKYLHRLRELRLVDFEDRKPGTTRTLVHGLIPPTNLCSCMLGTENESGGGAVDAAPRLPNAPRRR